MSALVSFFVFSHIISFVCSLFEAVLLSCTFPYVALLKKRGSRAAPLLEELKVNIDRPLAAILTLNTISHTIGAAGVGASVVNVFGDQWFAMASIILTLTMLYWTEMIPKTLGAIYWKRLAPMCALPIKLLINLTYPFVVSFNFFARILSRGKHPNRITEDDIRIALETGAKAGVIRKAEQDMVENIFRLGDRHVGVIMRPRVDIVWIDVNDSPEVIRDRILSSNHHRFPVCRGDINQVVGIVHSQDLLEKAWRGEKIDVAALAMPPLFINETQHVLELMDLFRKHHERLALVTDEYGAIQGIIAIGDILDAIVKGIEIEKKGEILPLNKRSWLADGKLPIDEFKEYFHFKHLPDEEGARYRTLSGLCMSQLDAIPKKGDTFQIGSYRFEIVNVHKKRVEKILITLADK